MKFVFGCIFLLTLACQLSAEPVKPGTSHSDGSVTCSTPVTLWLEDFTLPDSTVSDAGPTSWSVTNSSPSKNSVFAVYANEFKVNNITINGLGTWTSGIINIAGKTNISISVDVRSAGGLTADSTAHTDYLRLYYKIDGGPEVLFSDNAGKISNNATINTTVSTGAPSGSTLQLIIRAKATATSEFYYFDHVKVAGVAQSTVNAVAGTSGTSLLTCTTGTVILSASPASSNVSYSWVGPDNFTSTLQAPSISIAGTYVLTVTDTWGCAASSSVTIAQDTMTPTSVATNSVPANGLLTCSNTTVMLTGSSTTPGVTYGWRGPDGFTASGASAAVTAAGNYTVTVTNPNNGCFSTVTAATVVRNTTVPGAVSASVSDRLSCNNTSVTLTGNSTTAGATFAWAGPNGFTSASSVATVNVGGLYTLTATDPSNGCSFSRQITVQADQAHPAGVTAISEGGLSCIVGNVTLTGSSTTGGVTYTWTGPNGFFDPEQVVSVTDSGTYFLMVNNPVNGCSTIVPITVTADFTECSMGIHRAAIGHAASLEGTTGNTGATGFSYRLYPNPASTTAYVDLRSPVDAHVTVEVYNNVGIREKILFDGILQAGIPYQWSLDASRLTSGVHYCIIRTNNKVYTGKLLSL